MPRPRRFRTASGHRAGGSVFVETLALLGQEHLASALLPAAFFVGLIHPHGRKLAVESSWRPGTPGCYTQPTLGFTPSPLPNQRLPGLSASCKILRDHTVSLLS